MSKKEFIIENFIGLPYQEQLNLLSYLNKSIKDFGTKKVIREFEQTFSYYQEKLYLLLGFLEEYPTYNSDKRRLTRKTAFEELKDIAYEHHISNCDERVIQQFGYSSEYYGETKKYFKPQPATKEDVEEFKKEYERLNNNRKRDFIDDFIYAYQRIRYLELPNQTHMLELYRPIIKEILGEDLMTYYDKLYPTEQMRYILDIIEDYRWSKIDEEYYNLKLKALSETPKVLRNLKQQTISACRSSLE